MSARTNLVAMSNHRKCIIRTRSGFTLVEVLLSIGLFALLSIVLAGWLRQGARSMAVGPQIMHQQAHLVQIAQVIRQGVAIGAGTVQVAENSIRFQAIPIFNESGRNITQQASRAQPRENVAVLGNHNAPLPRLTYEWRWHQHTLWWRLILPVPANRPTIENEVPWTPALNLRNKSDRGAFKTHEQQIWLTINDKKVLWLGPGEQHE